MARGSRARRPVGQAPAMEYGRVEKSMAGGARREGASAGRRAQGRQPWRGSAGRGPSRGMGAPPWEGEEELESEQGCVRLGKNGG